VIPDRTPGTGPLGAIESALSYTTADWNLIVACDMPAIQEDFLRQLLETAESSEADAVVPIGPSGRPEPLIAVYHCRCRNALRQALDAGIRKVTDAFAGLNVRPWVVQQTAWFENVNTPADWVRHEHDAR
jgi:molybdopterin-guanine dinucleotide biosynthesis protein A